MYGEKFFFQALVFLAAAVISVPVAKRLGMSSVLGYLFAGFIIGPFGLNFIGAEGQDIMHFAEFGVIMMLFLIGIELEPSMLWRMRDQILGMGSVHVGVTSAVIFAVAYAFGLPFQTALAVGMILSLSSTAIVLQTLNEKGLMRTDGGQRSFSVLLFQDIAVIPMLALMPLLAVSAPPDVFHGHSGSALWVEGLSGWMRAFVVLAVIAAIIIIGRFIARHIFHAIAKTRLREIFTAAALLLVIGIAILMSKIGLSPALGTFVAGVVLANSEYRHELVSDIEPFKGLLLGLFFITIGASIDFGLVVTETDIIAALVFGLIFIKFIILFGVGYIFKIGRDQNMLFSLALAQGGEFAFVLFSFAVRNNVMPFDIANFLIAAVVLSMALNPVLWVLYDKFIRPKIGTKEDQSKEADAIDERNPVIIAGFGSFGSVIGRLLRANGVAITVLEMDSDKVELLRNLGLKVFYGDASRYDLLHSAGADDAKLLILTINDHEKMLEIINTVKRRFPKLKVLARAAGRTEAYELLGAGIKHVYLESLDTSLRIGVDALRELGFRAYQAHRASKTFRYHDERSIIELSHLRHDKKGYITQARQRIEDLEELLLSELKEEGEHLDVGWDTATMREDSQEKQQG